MISNRSILPVIKKSVKEILWRPLRLLQDSLCHLLYPTKCLHCCCLLAPDEKLLCPGCASLLDLLSPDNRCPVCFHLFSEEALHCPNCIHYPSLFNHMAAAFSYEGPASSLVKGLKYGNQPYLAKGMGAFLVAQWERLGWPIPDALVPVPLSIGRWIERGYNQSALLAHEMGGILKRPVWDVLKRQSGDFSQTALSLEMRKMLRKNRFALKKSHLLANRVILVVDDVMTTGTTLRCCAQVINQANPTSIYALTFCCT